jgi:hypothetical protein
MFDLCSEYNLAPIGCMLHDLDFYSSTRDALTLSDRASSYFLPRVFVYFDDIVEDDVWLPNEFTGELLAINEFNQNHRSNKICKNRFGLKRYPNSWRSDQMHIYHDFERPRFNDFIDDRQHVAHKSSTRLGPKTGSSSTLRINLASPLGLLDKP